MYRTKYISPLGTLVLRSDGENITGCCLNTGEENPAAPFRDLPVVDQARQWLDAYFLGADAGQLPPLKPEGTYFQRLVWEKLLAIAWGDHTSYGAIAREIAAGTGKRMSAQAVGGAVGRNPILLMIPCHRVLGAKGQLTGFAYGLEAKRWLLEHEGIFYTD